MDLPPPELQLVPMNETNLRWIDLYQEAMGGLTHETSDRFHTPQKSWLLNRYGQLLSEGKLPSSANSIVSLGAGVSNLPIDIAERFPGIPLSAFMFDVAYESDAFTEQIHRSWIRVLKSRFNRTPREDLYERSNRVKTFANFLDADPFLLQLIKHDPFANEYSSEKERHFYTVDLPLLPRRMTPENILKITEYIANMLGSSLRFSGTDYRTFRVPQSSTLELVQILNYLDGRDLLNWIRKNQSMLDVVALVNGDERCPKGNTDFLHPSAISTEEIVTRLAYMGYQPMYERMDIGSGDRSMIMISDRFTREPWYVRHPCEVVRAVNVLPPGYDFGAT